MRTKGNIRNGLLLQYHDGRNIAVVLLHDATAVISNMCEEGGVLFQVSFDSDIVVPIC